MQLLKLRAYLKLYKGQYHQACHECSAIVPLRYLENVFSLTDRLTISAGKKSKRNITEIKATTKTLFPVLFLNLKMSHL